MGGQPGRTPTFYYDGASMTALFPARYRALCDLMLGKRHPVALDLQRLLLSRTALYHESAPELEAILFGPDHLTLPLLKRSLRAAEAMESRSLAG